MNSLCFFATKRSLLSCWSFQLVIQLTEQYILFERSVSIHFVLDTSHSPESPFWSNKKSWRICESGEDLDLWSITKDLQPVIWIPTLMVRVQFNLVWQVCHCMRVLSKLLAGVVRYVKWWDFIRFSGMQMSIMQHSRDYSETVFRCDSTYKSWFTYHNTVNSQLSECRLSSLQIASVSLRSMKEVMKTKRTEH